MKNRIKIKWLPLFLSIPVFAMVYVISPFAMLSVALSLLAGSILQGYISAFVTESVGYIVDRIDIYFWFSDIKVNFLKNSAYDISDKDMVHWLEFIVAASGPSTSFAIACFAMTIAALMPSLGFTFMAAIIEFFIIASICNGLIFLVSMIPAYPMDGHKMLFSALNICGYSERMAENLTIGIGILIGLCLLILGVWSGSVILCVLAVVVIISNIMNWGAHEKQHHSNLRPK